MGTDKLSLMRQERIFYSLFTGRGSSQGHCWTSKGAVYIQIIRCSKSFWELSSYHHISKKKLWKKCDTTIWPPTNSGAKISALFTGFRICKNIGRFDGGLCYHRPACLKKDQKLEFFCSNLFWNLNFGISKLNFLWKLWSFWDMIY